MSLTQEPFGSQSYLIFLIYVIKKFVKYYYNLFRMIGSPKSFIKIVIGRFPSVVPLQSNEM